jgi:hypothetical protein
MISKNNLVQPNNEKGILIIIYTVRQITHTS